MTKTLKLTKKPCKWKRISQPYKAKTHKGIDLANVTGTPVYATAGGVVVAASNGAWDSSYGNMVAIYHGNGNYTNHAHLSKIKVRVGQRVKAGDTIGLMGSTGRSTGPHLHFEVHSGKKWNRVDPEPYINKVGPKTKYTVKTKGGSLNVRANPSGNAKIVGHIPNGKVVIGTGTVGHWKYIDEYNGWVYSAYLIRKG